MTTHDGLKSTTVVEEYFIARQIPKKYGLKNVGFLISLQKLKTKTMNYKSSFAAGT